ncbi:MAG: IMP dehydrogenase, partial [Chitinophagaceae bacterium]
MASSNTSLQDKFPGKFFGEGLTFDDVLLVPAYSEVLPREVSLNSRLT